MSITHLEAIELALREAGRPLSSRELVKIIREMQLVELSGETPHKTIVARLSTDIIRNGTRSVFIRTAQGRFSLKEFDWEPIFVVKARVINPLEEYIKVVDRNVILQSIVKKDNSGLYLIDRTKLIKKSATVLRSDAERRFDIVQLIPCFVIRRYDEILTFQRTKRLPEERLHNTKSVNFGGHLQSEDFPELFSDMQEMVDLFLMRELHEELAFSIEPAVNYLGGLYLENTNFERQHFGVVFVVDVFDKNCDVVSVEPGYHTNLKFEYINDLVDNIERVDTWSQVLINEMMELKGGH